MVRVAGRTVTSKVLEDLKLRAGTCSRGQLARHLCEQMDWRSPGGARPLMTARLALKKLTEQGHLPLPPAGPQVMLPHQFTPLPRGSIRATVLIETIPAAFEMHEILYELREHSAGLNCGRWDYIFSIIKKFRRHDRFTMPDRSLVTMTTHGMHSYSLLTIKTCHRRGIHAMGGMAAQIPIKNDPQANHIALEKVRADKIREADDGHDGTWVAHPGLVAIAREAFDARMPNPNQIDHRRDDIHVTAEDLLAVPAGEITEQGLSHNIDVGIQYMAAWLGGNGCVPIYNLMEDAATSEICRSQVWQWIHQPRGTLADGRRVTPQLCHSLFDRQLDKLRQAVGPEAFAAGHYELARNLIEGIVMKDEFTEFMTLVGYEHLNDTLGGTEARSGV